MRAVGPGKDTVGRDGYGRGQYRLELLEKATGEESVHQSHQKQGRRGEAGR